jgi:hypothetical protein
LVHRKVFVLIVFLPLSRTPSMMEFSGVPWDPGADRAEQAMPFIDDKSLFHLCLTLRTSWHETLPSKAWSCGKVDISGRAIKPIYRAAS